MALLLIGLLIAYSFIQLMNYRLLMKRLRNTGKFKQAIGSDYVFVVQMFGLSIMVVFFGFLYEGILGVRTNSMFDILINAGSALLFDFVLVSKFIERLVIKNFKDDN
jgi:hypothetical protein